MARPNRCSAYFCSGPCTRLVGGPGLSTTAEWEAITSVARKLGVSSEVVRE